MTERICPRFYELLTMTPALPWAPINQASKTEKSKEVATPPSNLPIIRIEKFLKSSFDQ